MKNKISLTIAVVAFLFSIVSLIVGPYIAFPDYAESARYNYFFLRVDSEPITDHDGYISGSISYKMIKVRGKKHLAELKTLYPDDAGSFLNVSLYE